jgi:hypothetical protein
MSVPVFTQKPTTIEARFRTIDSNIALMFKPGPVYVVVSLRQTENKVERQIFTEKKSKRYAKRCLK